jgi:hypothetical protein
LTQQPLPRTVVWQNQQTSGLEYCTLWPYENNWLLDGQVIVIHNGRPLHIHYRIGCDTAWETRAVLVTMRSGAMEQTLQFTVDHHQHWWTSGTELPDLRGCVDVDLSITPATNILPIRRLNLSPNAGQDVVAAWIRFPELTIQPLTQRYTYLEGNRYRYESGNGAFVAEIKVDELGLVLDYPPGWTRIATMDEPITGPTPSPEI